MQSEEATISLQQPTFNSKLSFEVDQLLCSKGNKSLMLCHNKNCQRAPFICSKKDCQCQQTHRKCLKIMSQQFFLQIGNKIISTDAIKSRVDTIVNEAIDYISKIRDEIEFNLKYLGLNHQEKELIHLLQKKQFGAVTGAKVWKVAQLIYQQKQISSDYMINEIDQFWDRNQESFKKNFQKLKDLTEKQCPNLALFLDSDIIKNTQDVHKLFGFFDKDIVSTKLLFSAQKQKYKMRNYYKSCQGKKNILLIARSKQGKVFGGFWKTQINKEQGLGSGYIIYPKGSFVFSLTNKDKFQPQLQVNHYGNNILLEGPNFGYDFLAIYQEEPPKFKENPLHPPTVLGGGLGYGGGGFVGGFGGPMMNPVQFGAAFTDGGLNGQIKAQKNLTNNYCVIFYNKNYFNEKYTSDADSRIKFAGTKQKMFPITEWEVHQLEFNENTK